MSEPNEAAAPPNEAPGAPPIESPPPSAAPARAREPDPKVALKHLSDELRRKPDRRKLSAFLQLRRATR